MRADSAGASHGFVQALRDQNILFSIGFPIDFRIRDAVLALPATVWVNARTQHDERREGAAVAELHALDLTTDGWPDGTRVIVRREPLHPGAQQSFLDADGHRIPALSPTSPTPTSPSWNAAPRSRPRGGPHPQRQDLRAGQPAVHRLRA